MPTTAPKPVAPRTRSAEVAAAVVARMAALNPAFELDVPRHQSSRQRQARPAGPRIAIGQPGRGRVAAALGLGR